MTQNHFQPDSDFDVHGILARLRAWMEENRISWRHATEKSGVTIDEINRFRSDGDDRVQHHIPMLVRLSDVLGADSAWVTTGIPSVPMEKVQQERLRIRELVNAHARWRRLPSQMANRLKEAVLKAIDRQLNMSSLAVYESRKLRTLQDVERFFAELGLN